MSIYAQIFEKCKIKTIPLSFVEVEEIMSKKVYKSVDHHGKGTN